MIVNTGRLREPILRDTTQNTQKDIKEKHLAGLISSTTGMSMGSPSMTGVLQSTVPAGRRDVPEIHKVPKSQVGKTQTRTMGQVNYTGKMF